jgi:RNA polymerase sigma-70 factor (ECF subfamily)
VSTGKETFEPVDVFEAHRGSLLGLAYRMTGSLADAEDILQEAYLRWERSDVQSVLEPRAFLATTVTRLCLDVMKSARARRESYVGPWLPEPVLGEAAMAVDDATELAQDVSMALMMALERLSPLERAAFLLHDVFDTDYPRVAETLGRSEEACRQLAARGRAHVKAARPRFRPSRDECQRVVQAFGAAVLGGDVEALEKVLADDVLLYSDGGGRVTAALRPIEGRDKVARFLIGVTQKFPLGQTSEFLSQLVNGAPGLLIREEGQPMQTLAFDVRHGRIVAMYVVRNPEKLARLAAQY